MRRTSGPDEYTQVKYSVDASKPVSSEWFTTRGPGAGSKSPLERFMASWHLLKSKGMVPDLLLFTNRVLDPTDPVLKLRCGTTGTLGQRLATERPRSAARKAVAEWVKHAGVTEPELMELLCRLGLKTDQGPWSELGPSGVYATSRRRPRAASVGGSSSSHRRERRGDRRGPCVRRGVPRCRRRSL